MTFPMLKIRKGNDATQLDETLTQHNFHCPYCDVHLTSLGLCAWCGRRLEIPTCLYTVGYSDTAGAKICGDMATGYYKNIPVCAKHLDVIDEIRDDYHHSQYMEPDNE